MSEVRGRVLFHRFQGVLQVITCLYSIFPRAFRKRLLIAHRNQSGIIACGLRYCLLKSLAIHVGQNVGIDEHVYLKNPQNLEIGDNVSINPMCYIECGRDPNHGVKIGNDVAIAHGVTIISETHKYADLDINIKDQGMEYRSILIEDNVWIGAKASILAGVTIGTGSVIGAGAVVTHDVAPNTVVGGVPAGLIKQRG